MTSEEFRKHGHEVINWVSDYLENLEKYPVKSPVKPKDIIRQLPDEPPEKGESFEQLMQDLEKIIMPGITHWQHPGFYAYFNANNSYPSILAEVITAGIGAQCMVWDTSPAAAELEEQVMEWFKKMMNLPSQWHGVIQDTASTATLASMLTAREWKTDYQTNESGFDQNNLRVYCSDQTHSSIEKGAKIAGFGKKNVVKIPTCKDMSMDTDQLEMQISNDIKWGYNPCIVISTLGTTGTLAFDDIEKISKISKANNLWHHVDAAYAGNAFILPEYQHYLKGIEDVDSYVFNPHKWLFTNFDASAYFVKDKELLLKTFEILPEYLKTKTRGKVNDYRDWGIPLGRRFRALKLWFVIRTYGVSGIQHRLSEHIQMAKWLENQINNHPEFEMVTSRTMNLIVMRYHPNAFSENDLNTLNESLLNAINESGKAFLTHTKIGGKYVIRVNIGGSYVEKRHIESLWEQLKATVNKIKTK